MKRELMKQLFDEFIDSQETISKIEHNFGRTLTDSERILVIEQGEQALLNKLGIDDADYKTMRRALSLISAGFTESSDRYDEELEKENYKALDLFKSLVNDLEFVNEVKAKKRRLDREIIDTKIRVNNEKEYIPGYKEENDPDLDKVFADVTCSKELGITGDTYDEKKDNECKEYFTKDSTKEAAESKLEIDPFGDTDDQCKDYFTPESTKEASESEETSCNKCITKEKAVKEGDQILDAVEKLDKGQVIELKQPLLDKVVDYLWRTRDNISIKIHNNKISIK